MRKATGDLEVVKVPTRGWAEWPSQDRRFQEGLTSGPRYDCPQHSCPPHSFFPSNFIVEILKHAPKQRLCHRPRVTVTQFTSIRPFLVSSPLIPFLPSGGFYFTLSCFQGSLLFLCGAGDCAQGLACAPLEL